MWTIVLLPLVILIVIAAVIAAGYVSAGSSKSPRSRAPGFVLVIAALSAIGVAVSTLIAATQALFAPSVTVTLPVQPFRPDLLPNLTVTDGPTSRIVGGDGFTAGDFSIEGLDLAARMWLALGYLTNGAALLIVVLLVIELARRARSDEPFRRLLSNTMARAGITLGVGAVVWQICFSIGNTLAAQQALQILSWNATGLTEEWLDWLDAIGLDSSGLPRPGLQGEVEFWPIGVGLALIALAAVFRSGERLQRDTEGLV